MFTYVRICLIYALTYMFIYIFNRGVTNWFVFVFVFLNLLGGADVDRFVRPAVHGEEAKRYHSPKQNCKTQIHKSKKNNTQIEQNNP